MPGRKWLLIGAVIGVAIALGHVPYLAGAARVLAETALRLVSSGGNRLISAGAHRGAPRRVVLGFTALVAVLAPGITALLLVVAGRSTIRIRALVGMLLALLGVASYFYHPDGVATGVIVLALAVAAVAVVASGPLVAAPLAALAGLIGGTYLPRLLLHRATVERTAVREMHTALYGRVGDPAGLQIALVAAAAVPFALALRWIVRR